MIEGLLTNKRDIAMVTIESTLEYVSALRDSGLVSARMDAPLATIGLLLRNLPVDRLERLKRVETCSLIAKACATFLLESAERAEMAVVANEIMALRSNLR
jgi:hypothetical protein